MLISLWRVLCCSRAALTVLEFLQVSPLSNENVIHIWYTSRNHCLKILEDSNHLWDLLVGSSGRDWAVDNVKNVVGILLDLSLISWGQVGSEIVPSVGEESWVVRLDTDQVVAIVEAFAWNFAVPGWRRLNTWKFFDHIPVSGRENCHLLLFL
jgi:hypothetical protein